MTADNKQQIRKPHKKPHQTKKAEKGLKERGVLGETCMTKAVWRGVFLHFLAG